MLLCSLFLFFAPLAVLVDATALAGSPVIDRRAVYTATVPACMSTKVTDANKNEWQEIYVGSGFTEAPTNPNNADLTPLTLEFATGVVSQLGKNTCAFLQECLTWAWQWENLWSVDLHLLANTTDGTGTGKWVCVGYQATVGGTLGGVNYYTVAPSTGLEVVSAFGYDLTGSFSTPCPVMAQSVQALNCGASYATGGDTWTQQYFGSCWTASISTQNVIMSTPVTSNQKNLDQSCAFLTSCMAYAKSFESTVVYQNVAAYLVLQTGRPGYSQWQCTAYFGLAPSPSTSHSVSNSTILLSFVYYRPALPIPICPATIAATVAVAGSGGWTVAGCYNDTVGVRALNTSIYEIPSDSMTNEACQAVCQRSGFVYSGTENGGECFCGNSILNYAALSTGCDVACNGQPADECGGANRLTLSHYSDVGAVNETGYTWFQTFTGSGFEERATDPNTPRTGKVVLKTWPEDTATTNLASGCTFLQQCLNLAYTTNPMNIDFHLIQDTASTTHWVCIGYTNNALQNAFTVTNGNVLAAFGYDLIMGCTPNQTAASIYNDPYGWRWDLLTTPSHTGTPAKSPSGPIALMLADTCAHLSLIMLGIDQRLPTYQFMDYSLVQDSPTTAHWEGTALAAPIVNSSQWVAASSNVLINYRYNRHPGLAFSRNGACGPYSGPGGAIGCQGSSYGNCCSADGLCGATGAFCGTGCKPSLGDCLQPTTSNTCGVSGNAMCGGDNGCCGSADTCGSGAAFCNGGCQPQYGTCNSLQITFYTLQNYGGSADPEYGVVNTCYDLASAFIGHAQSMTFTSRSSCTLYKAAGCTGASELHTPSTKTNNAFTTFSNMVYSYKCNA